MINRLMPTVYSKTFKRENFRGFHSFSLNSECFLTNYGLVDWQCNTPFTLSRVTQNGYKPGLLNSSQLCSHYMWVQSTWDYARRIIMYIKCILFRVRFIKLALIETTLKLELKRLKSNELDDVDKLR